MNTISIWKDSSESSNYPVLSGDLHVDIAIIGGGITGITAAYLLAKAGKKVAVLEANKIGESSTGYSTGNLYATVGNQLQTIESKFNKETTGIVVESRTAAVNFIADRVKEYNIDCDFKRVPWYLFTEIENQVSTIDKEKKASENAGLTLTSETTSILFPTKIKAGIKLADQAQFNPLQYVKGLAKNITGDCKIFENTAVIKIEEDKTPVLHTNSGKVHAGQVIMVTHTPKGFNLVQTALGPYREYALGIKINGIYPPAGIYWDQHETQHYSVRPYTNKKGTFLLVLGESHKVGQKENNEECFRKLEEYARTRFDVEEVVYTWSAQNYKAADGLPYIGKSGSKGEVYIATGFAADGLTYGTLAAMILSDELTGKKNKWAKTYDAGRFTPLASAKDFIKENVNVAAQYMKDLPFKTDEKEFTGIAPGEGKIMEIKGNKCAVYRDENKNIQVVSAVCTHLGCIVHFNSTEKSWDCPCHGSRFTTEGKVIEGPALTDLEKKY